MSLQTPAPIDAPCLPGEQWRPIAEFPRYVVSNLGRVGSQVGAFKTLGLNVQQSGYVYVDLYKESRRSNHRVSRLVALAFLSNPDNKPEVNHLDGDKSNNKASNLEWATGKENMKHAINTGLKSILCGTKV